MKSKTKQNNTEKCLITYQYRIKDSSKTLKKHLYLKSGAVNFVWNYCNCIQQEAVKRSRRWLSDIDLCNLTSGSSKELNLHSQSVQAICEEYVLRRKQFNKPYLKFRTNKKKRNLPWIPFKGSAIRVDETGTFTFQKLKLKTWYSRQIPKNATIKSGNICCDNQDKWFINIVLELNLTAEERLALTSKGQNITAMDPGLNPLLTLSIESPDNCITYKEIEPPKYFKRSQERLANAQRARKKKFARSINKKIKNQRKDYHYKLANELVVDSCTIINTDLSFKSLMKSKLKGHAKAWQDGGLGTFRSILKTKAQRHNVTYVEVSERILVSTQTCSYCKALTGPRGRKGLSVSAWTCSKCGRHHLRNRNSADNHRLAYKPFVETKQTNKTKRTLPDMGVYSGITVPSGQ